MITIVVMMGSTCVGLHPRHHSTVLNKEKRLVLLQFEQPSISLSGDDGGAVSKENIINEEVEYKYVK